MDGGSSSAMFLAMREELQNQHEMNQQGVLLHHQQAQSSTMAQSQAQATTKKRRNQPGTPNPDAEVIALSPHTLMATNRFLCEVCNKGFQREQNLQLHRRGHNLPWKLKQKNPNEVAKRKVYLCPEPTCVHHEPSRALGDLTGIKKHYFRKHGEKKYKCEKCSKKYAVQSDWKAHSKTCGTREYRCDCGTLFSRRDSFITHRAFCDALAQESTRNPPTLSAIGNQFLYGNSNNINLGLSKLGSTINNTKTNGYQFDNNLINGTPIGSSSSFFLQESNQDYANTKPMVHGLMQLPNLDQNNNNTPSMFGLNFFQNNSSNTGFGNSNNLSTSGILGDHNNISCSMPSLYGSQVENSSTCSAAPVMSATALLQKAAQIGSTTSNISTNASLLKAFGSTNTGVDNSSSSGTKSDHQALNFGNDISDGVMDAYGGGSQGYNTTTKLSFEQHQPPQKKQLTRDFLGVGEIVRSMSGGFSSQREQQQQQHNGLNMMSSLFDPERNQGQQSFGNAGNFQ
ncbi:protein indeterminate-domain 5, chloroplastic-like [Lycium ferocissimum]|uniref:protein indeterminate-domain 5, chloroplastic-like n=1 Tax=Lycium ferocissimum TaxID=112874 RepID=UPI0028149848|nr:protein indeterminate-domain 5, chloroplastic-like [Lycium ferocissimum]XP_059291827.1 protein indeterminate-domain 5, chloroplastic-like [Lycium ferocissimum]